MRILIPVVLKKERGCCIYYIIIINNREKKRIDLIRFQFLAFLLSFISKNLGHELLGSGGIVGV